MLRTFVIFGTAWCYNPIGLVGDAIMTSLDCDNPYAAGLDLWFYSQFFDYEFSDIRRFGASL